MTKLPELYSCKNTSSLTGSGAKTLSSPAKTTSSSAVALKISGTTNINNNSCVPYTVIFADSAGLSANVIQDLTVAMNGAGAGAFYSDSACTTEQSTVTITAGTSLSYAYYSNPNAQNLVFSATATGVSATTFPVTVTTAGNASSSAVKFALTGPNSLRVQECSSAFIIKSTNSSGVEFTVSSNTTVNITGKGGGNFYSDAACTSIVSSVVFSANDSSKPFYYKGTTVESLTFNVDDVGSLTPASTGVAIVADLPSKLIVTGSTPITLGDCRAFNVTVKDLNNFSSAVQSTTSINLTGAGAGVFYSDSSCVGSTTSIVINSGQSSALFYFKTFTSGGVTLSADNSGGLTLGTKAVTVDPLPFTKVVMSRPGLVAGNCTAISVTLKDSLNNASVATSPVGVTLSSNGNAVFYSASSCLSVITSATITTGQSSSTIYLKDTSAESVTLGVVSTGLASDSWSPSVVAGSNNTLKLTGPATNSVGSCMAYDLRLEDSLGNLSQAASSTTINFTGLSSAKFYSDSGCTTIANSISLAANSNLTQIYLKGSTAESLTLGASSGALVAASKVVSLIAGSSNKLILNGASVASAGACTNLSAEIQDSFNNRIVQGSAVALTLSGNASGSFYSDSGCTASATIATITIGNSSTSFWFKSSVPASQNLIVQGSGLFEGTKNFSINPLSPTKLVMTGSTSITAGVCTAYSVSLQDTLNNLSAVGSAKTLNFSGALSGAFYFDSSCVLPASSLSLTSTQTTAQIYYKASVAQSPNLTVDDSGLPDLAFSILPVSVNSSGGGTSIVLKISGSSNINNNTCVPYAIITTDSGGFSSNVTSNLTATMGGAGTGFFYSDSGCTTAGASVSILSGTSLSYVYYLNSGAQNLVFSATATGASATTLPVAVSVFGTSSSKAVRFAVTGPGSLKVQECSSAFVIKTTNSTGVEFAVAEATIANLTGKGSGDFYSDAGCSAVVSSVTFAASDSSKPFYYKGTTIESLTFNVDDVGSLTPASTGLAIVADAPTKFVISGSTPITLGDCRAFTVTTKDVNNFTSTVMSTISINLTGAGAGTFYSDSSCIGSTASVAISSGQSSALFYYKSLSSGIVTLSADNSGALTAGTKVVTVDALPYTKVIFSRPSIVAGNCATVTISLKDSLNNTSPATSSVGVSLASSGSSVFYSASNCASGVITSATVAISQSSTTVYLKDTVAETITLGATSTGLTSDSWNTTVAAGSNNALKLVGPATNSVGSCTAYDLRLEDSLGNLSLAVSSTSVNFTGLSNARFYSDVNCTTLASSGTILAASALTQVYLKGNVAESVTIAANSGSLVAASKAVSLIAGSSNKLIINGVTTALAGACTALSVEVQDSLNNPITQGAPLVATMSGNVSGSFYSELGCTVAATTATIALSNSSATIWFKSNIPSSLSLNAQGSGLFDGTKNFSINPLAPTKLVMTGSTNITAGVCTAYSISLEDTLNNMSSAGNSKILNFSGGLSGAFYSDSSCALPASSISLTSTQTTAQIYYKASAAQTPNLLVDDSGLPDLVSSTLPVTVVSSGGSSTISLKISGSTSINTSSCVPYAIITTDTSGLSYNVTTNTSVTLGGAGTELFYSNSICTTASPTVTIASGTSLSYIYYSSATAQNLVFSAIASGASANTLPVAVVSGAASFGASRLTIAGSSSISTGSCIPYVVSVADLNGNSVNAVANTTVSFAGKGLGDFYSNDTCSTSAAGSAVVSAATSYTTVYYKNTNVQNLIFVAQSTGLSNGTLSVGITSTTGSANSGPAVKLSFVAQPSSVASTNENFGEQPIVIVQDSNNNVASSSSATITLAAYADSACSLSAGPILQATTNPLISNGGVANFAGVKITSALAIYLKASSPGLASICSQAVQVYPSVPSKLSFSLQPSTTAIAGDGLTIQPQVSVLNYTNQVLTNAINAVSISAYTDSTCSTSATGIFNLGVNNVIPSVGVVAFSGISYSIASTIYLKATSSGLTSACSSGITVSPAPAYQLGVYYQPAAAGKAGDTFSLTTRLYDSFGNTSLSTHNLTLTAYKSNNCTGSTSVITGKNSTTTLGTATFASIVFAEASTMSLKISDLTDPTVYVACSTAIVVDGGAPSKLSFSTQPSSTSQIYVSLATPPAVMVQDSFSNQVKSATIPITLSAYSDSGCSTTPALGALTAINLTVSQTGGISTFGSVTYSLAQVIYLKAASSGLTSACSSAIALTNLSTKISTKGNTSCGVVSGGVKCWGANGYGQLGDSSKASTPYPAMVTNTNGYGALSGITDVAVGNAHACALDSAGAVYCWGHNGYGQLGDATGTVRLIPVQVVGVTASGFLSNIVSITAGDMHTCALSNTGAVYCWGYNGLGQLGDNTTTNISYPTQVKGVGGTGLLSSISSISAGDNHTCAVSSTGAAYCWGYNVYGQLGDNTSGTNRLTPIQVKGVGATGNLANIISISAGTLHTCAASSSGAAYCWGYNANGQLGDNTLNNSSTPIQVIGVGGTGNLANIISISAGGITGSTGHTCAINSSRNLFCWGYNANGQLGDNTTTARSTPTQVLGVGASGNLSSIISVSAGLNGTCALSDDGYMYCWGDNSYWQLGDQTKTQRNTPVKVKENSNTFTSVSAKGDGYSCGVSNEKVYCWGHNGYGQIGDGTTTNRNLPTLVPTLNGVKQVSTGLYTTCAVLNTGAVYCWGYNNSGQLGDGTTGNRSSPVLVTGISNAIAVSTSGQHSCAVTSSGPAYCWGYNADGQLGDGTTTARYNATLVSGGLSFTGITTAYNSAYYGGLSHTCGITNTGAAYCWGNGSYYQIGDGGATSRVAPTQVSGFTSGVTAIDAISTVTCAIKSGIAYCWGYMYDNQWSISNIGSTPNALWGASTATSISTGQANQCAVINNALTCYSPIGLITHFNQGYGLKDIKSFSISGYGNNNKICALKANGVLYCWGYEPGYTTYNYGTASTTSTPTIVAIPPTSSNTLTSVAVGETQSCGILNGVVQCWGTSAAGALGSGLTTSLTPNPVLLASTSSYLLSQASVAAGGTHSCSLSTIGDVYCWGDNSFGKLGNNSTVASNKAIQVLGAGGIGTLASVASLAVGYRHNCAVISGYTYCWGYNTSGQLGIDSTMTMGSATQVVGVGGTGYLGGSSKVVAGRAHTCSLVSGNVYCWGSNQYGQLGANSSVSQSNTPLKVVSVSGVGTLNNVTSIAAGAYHTCALASGIIYCWGANSAQQLGNGATQDSSYPVGVMNSDYITLSGVTSISAGVKHSCAITSVGEVYCWGSGAYGQLGLNATVDVGAATKVLGLGGTGVLTANMLATGSSANHSCAISTDQTNIYCWGLGTSGQMGNNASTSAQLYPTPFTYSSILYLMVR